MDTDQKSNSVGIMRRRRNDSFSASLFNHSSQISRYDYSSCSSSRDNLAMIQDCAATEEDVTDCRAIISSSKNLQGSTMFEGHMNVKVVTDRRKWTVGKLSFMMLILFSLTDVLLNIVDAQMDSLEAPDYYDALSADVIRPAFKYHSSGTDRSTQKQRMGLGSAAISSVTNALSPILPFAGGLDLRREDYWTNGLLGSVSNVVEQVREAFADDSPVPTGNPTLLTPRGGARVAQRSSKSKSKGLYTSSLSSAESFVPLMEISELTLNEVSLAFRFALESTRFDFNTNRFMSGVASRVKHVVIKMSDAAAKSRGSIVAVPSTGVEVVSGDIDALQFCAAMRILAEWRLLRQVPEGYKGYSVGMSLGQKDVVQNVGKIEQAVHNWLNHQAEVIGELGEDYKASQPTSPTLRDLLDFEADMGLHDKLPRLKEKSAAMGLLWVRRQLHYQSALFANVIQVPERFDTAGAAISSAYSEVYDRYHGWAVQKIFNYSFQAAPDTAEVYKVMNPRKLEEVSEAARTKSTGAGMERKNKFQHIEEGNPFEKLGRHIGREWEKLARPVVQLLGQHSDRRRVENMRGGSVSVDPTLKNEIDSFINEQMQLDAHEHIVAFLTVAQPLLGDLATLFDEFNMDDPTKV